MDGREYRGQFQNGKKHGLGTFVFVSGVWDDNKSVAPDYYVNKCSYRYSQASCAEKHVLTNDARLACREHTAHWIA